MSANRVFLAAAFALVAYVAYTEACLPGNLTPPTFGLPIFGLDGNGTTSERSGSSVRDQA